MEVAMTQGVLNFEPNTPGIRGKQHRIHKLAHGTSIQALIYQIIQEAQKPLIEGEFVYVLFDRYKRRASGSSVSRQLRYLQEDDLVIGKRVVIDNVKKNWKEWTRKGEVNA
jgi:hypothetical protein